MTFEFAWSIVAFSFGMATTPGPNNTVAFSTGMNYGFLHVLPYMAGVATGLPLMIAGVAFGLREFLETFPQFYQYLRAAGSAYILYLAWKVATASPSMPVKQKTADDVETPQTHAKNARAKDGKIGRDRCPTYINGLVFQWLNPKAWILAVAGTTYLGKDLLSFKLVFLCVMISVSCVVGNMLWGAGGAFSGRFIRSERAARALNIGMALLLLSSLLTFINPSV